MACGRKRKCDKGFFTDEQMRNAEEDVIKSNLSLRATAGNLVLSFKHWLDMSKIKEKRDQILRLE